MDSLPIEFPARTIFLSLPSLAFSLFLYILTILLKHYMIHVYVMDVGEVRDLDEYEELLDESKEYFEPNISIQTMWGPWRSQKKGPYLNNAYLKGYPNQVFSPPFGLILPSHWYFPPKISLRNSPIPLYGCWRSLTRQPYPNLPPSRSHCTLSLPLPNITQQQGTFSA